MWKAEEIKIYIKDLLKEKRFNHVLGVAEEAKKLAYLNNVDVSKCEIAALCHDVAKNMTIVQMNEIIKENNIQLSDGEKGNSELWHAIIGPIIAKNVFEIDDEEILEAIRWHTTGKENMNKIDEIIYIADMIEPNRKFNGVEEIREATYVNLQQGVVKGLNHTIQYLLENGKCIDLNTIKARNYYISKIY